MKISTGLAATRNLYADLFSIEFIIILMVYIQTVTLERGYILEY